MNPWAVNPSWQNFSSMYREAVTTEEARTGMERSRHLTASLYFGIAALQAFVNQKMRASLDGSKSEKEILDKLRKGKIIDHLAEWPIELLGKKLTFDTGTMDLFALFNDVRGDLTHPKTEGHDIYAKLETIDAQSVVDCVTEYIVRYSEAEGVNAPYWVFGWNYLNPRQGSHEIFLVNEQQFGFSLQALGLQRIAIDEWQNPRLGTFNDYLKVKNALRALHHCQPKAGPFPFMPVLCRRWWTQDHQSTCGGVTDQALENARKFAGGRRKISEK